ncbi:MAG TPA: carboxypeptidase-like regulatory domain-containing protein, partial [Thermoanaerobaculia bacterium]|nr:carboxypeptidase-like regulatory domain-containing protein [Thermoanaerobaculia bacterium]
MTRIKSTLAAALILALALAGSLWAAGEGRISGTVVDAAGAPVAGAKISITSPEFKYFQDKTTDSKGKFTLIVLDATRKYTIKIEKDGYNPFEGPLEVKLGENIRVSYTLAKAGGEAKPGGGAPEVLSGANQAISVYNEGVVAFQKS